MRIIKRILLSLIGIFLWIVGCIFMVISIPLMVSSFSGIDNISEQIFLAIWMFVISEVLLAFGITSLLMGLRCVFGPRQWIIKTIDYFWARAVKFAMIMPWLGIGFALIWRIIEFFMAMA